MKNQTGNSAPKLADYLNNLNVNHLKSIMNGVSVRRPHPTRKAEIVVAIRHRFTRSFLRRQWKDLDEIGQRAVSEALHGSEGCYAPDRFKAKYGALPSGLDSQLSNYYSTLKCFLYGGYRANTRWWIPEDLKVHFLEFVPPPPKTKLEAFKELPKTVDRESFSYSRSGKTVKTDKFELERRDMEHAALQDLYSVLRLIDLGRVSASAATKRASTASMQRVTEQLVDGDFFDSEMKKHKWDQTVGPIKAFAWPMLVQAGKLAELKGNKLALTKAGHTVLRAAAAEGLRRLFQGWMRNATIDEFSRIDEIKGQSRGNGRRAMTAAKDRRAQIASALKKCPIGEWVYFDDFSRYMQAAGFKFEITRDPWTLYLCESGYGSLGYDGYHEWGMLQGRYILCVLFEYFATLGMIDIAYTDPTMAKPDFSKTWGGEGMDWLSRYDGLEYFRLNPLGSYCLGMAKEYRPSVPTELTPITVLPDLRLHTEHALTADERLALQKFANAESPDVWRLAPDKTLDALENGHSIGSLREFLTARDSQMLPETVEGFLRKSERNSQALKVDGNAILIKCADETIAAELATNRHTSKLCMPLGKNHLAIRTASEKAFRKAVRSLGFGIMRS